LTADAVLAYGPGAEEAYRTKGSVSGPEIIAVGSPRLEGLRRRARRAPAVARGGTARRRRLLYATTAYSQNGWYLRTRAPFTDRLLYRDQDALVTAMTGWARRARGGIEGVIKLHPSERAQEPPWVPGVERDGHLSIVRRQPSLESLLLEADAVILDSPTTSALEAACTRLPLFVLTRHWDFSAELWQALGKRAACAARAEELAALVEEWLETGAYPAAVDDDGFLSRFGLPDGATAVAARAAAEVAGRIRPG
jgi:hypothetical protein